jgi:hypothetical protein
VQKNMRRYLRDHPAAFDPETIRIMSDALEDACQQAHALYKIDENAKEAREGLAKQIVHLATHGERDYRRLVQGALERLKL